MASVLKWSFSNLHLFLIFILFFQTDLFDKANETLQNLPEKHRSALFSRNKLVKTIYNNEKRCPNTILDILRVGIKNRNCLEPTFENYCSAIKQSPNIDGFSFFGDDTASEQNSNSLYLLFKYISGIATSEAQKDIVW